MKKKLLNSMRVLLVAAGLVVGAGASWAETVGSTTDGYLGNKSESITLTDGGIVNYVFSQTTADESVWQGFIVAANKTDGTELIRLRQDFWDNIQAGNTGCSANYPEGWVTNFHFFNNATVNMTITYSEGTFTMASTIYGSDNGEYTYGFTKAIDGAPSSIIVYLSNDHAQLSIGKVAVTNGTITTTTYDFTSMGNPTLTKGTELGKVYSQSAYIPTELAVYTNSQLSLWDRNWPKWQISTSGLYNSNNNTGGIYLKGLKAGDHISFTFSGANLQAASTGNANSSTTITSDGPLLGYWTNLTPGTNYYSTSESVSVVAAASAKVTGITVISNPSDNYATLFQVWRNASVKFQDENLTEGKTALKTAIDAAKVIIDANEIPADDYVAAIATLRTATDDYLVANENTKYSVNSFDAIAEGVTVNCVYGITMEFGGTWSLGYNNNQFKNTYYAGSSARPSNYNYDVVPSNGSYLKFTPTVTGNLKVSISYYGSNTTYKLVDEDGITYKSNTFSTLNYGEYDWGTIVAGKTYYLYQSSGSFNPSFRDFTFTPGAENTNTTFSLPTNSKQKVVGGRTVVYVNGIKMTFGGSSEDVWSVFYAGSNGGSARGWINATAAKTANGTAAASVENAIPASGTYMIFEPMVDGILTLNWYGFAPSSNTLSKAILTDGTGSENQTMSQSNGSKANTLSSILAKGSTYYVYFNMITSSGSETNKNGFLGFSYDTSVPASVSASIGETGFATFSSEYPLDFTGTTVKAYTASLTDENTVLLTKASKVPARTGLVLKGASETVPVATGFVSAPATNLLVASTTEDIAATEEASNSYNYVLANGSAGIGFYNVKEKSVNIGAGKAYLHTTTPLATSGNARVVWNFDDDETTGIVSTEKQSDTHHFYDLQGRRVAQPAKGIYIVNGKKVFVK